MLFQSTKNPGSYILRIEDSSLAEKLSKKSKDQSTRNFFRSLMIPRKIKFGNSWFYLDYFHISSWNLTKDIPREKVKGAIIVKNTSTKPMSDLMVDDDEEPLHIENLPPNYYLTSLLDFVPNTITIAFEEKYEGLDPVEFSFIKKDREKGISGVHIAEDVDLDSME
jgi:hypothetical protein